MNLGVFRQYILNRLKNELPAHYVYHTIEHTLDVCQAAQRIAEEENLPFYEQELLQTAALLHDFGYIEQAQGHEAISCDYAHQVLPEFGYTESEIKEICGIIMATKIPHAPSNHLGEILCDADLDYLGRTDFFDIGCKLFEEFLMFKIVESEKEWQEKQVSFLRMHRYYTDYSKTKRLPQKQINLSLVQDKLNSL